MPVDYIPRIQEKYAQEGYPAYRWVVNSDLPPWQPLRRSDGKVIGAAVPVELQEVGRLRLEERGV